MLDLLSALYSYDPFRFTLWAGLQAYGLDQLAADTIRAAGFILFEDWSISRR